MRFDLTIAIPSSGNCKAQFAYSLARMTMYYAQVPIYPEVTEQALEFLALEGTGVSANRERMVKKFLSTESTHLLFIDDDVGFNPNTLHILASRRLPVVACNYRLRSPPAPFMAWRDGHGVVETTKEKTGLEPVTYMGFGFCLMERKVLEEVEEPRFLCEYIDGHYSTEDSAFFKKCKYTPYIDHDASKLVWHVGNMPYVWCDDYSKLNKHLKDTT